MAKTITIVIPMPPDRNLFPNALAKGGHWGMRSTRRANSRKVAEKAAEKVRPRKPMAGPVIATIHARYGYRLRCPDLDATISAAKSFWDGIADAGVIGNDDQIKLVIGTHEKLRLKPGDHWKGETVMTLTEAGNIDLEGIAISIVKGLQKQ